MHSSVKYARLTPVDENESATMPAEQNPDQPTEPTFNFKSAFSYDEKPEVANSIHSYGSAFKYRDPHVKVRIHNFDDAELTPVKKSINFSSQI